MHRCGRTARIGRDGQAVVFLLPSEDAYIHFLRIRKVPIAALPPALQGEDTDTFEAVRSLAAAERDLYGRGKLAYVSFVRGYKEHQCSFIFQAKDLDFGRLAILFGLLHLPKMPELKAPESHAAFVPR